MSKGFLADSHRTAFEEGEFEYNADRSRVRRRFRQSIDEMNMVVENRDVVDPDPDARGEKKTLENYTSSDEVGRLMLNLLGLLGDNEVSLGQMGGSKQEVAIAVFLDAFQDYKPGEVDEYSERPHPTEIEGFQEVVNVIHSFYE